MAYNNLNDNEILYLIKDDRDNLDIIINKYKPIILSIANRYYKMLNDGSYDYDDLVQEGMLGLSNAVSNFNVNNGVMFYTYACVCIKKSILTFVNKIINKKPNVISLDFLFDNYPNIYDTVLCGKDYTVGEYTWDKFLEYIINFKNNLKFEESCIFELKCNGFSYNEISTLLDVKKKYVDNVLQKCRNKFSY